MSVIISKRRWLALSLVAAVAQADIIPTAVHVRGVAELAPQMQLAAERYMTQNHGASVVVVRGGSVFAMKSLLHGSTDIAMVLGPAPVAIRRDLQTMSPPPHQWVIGHHMLMPVVSARNPVQEIRLEHLQAIFAGQLTDWRQLGGAPGPIQALVESPEHGLGLAWKEAMVGEHGHLGRRTRLVSATDKLQILRQTPGGITFALAGQNTPEVRELRVVGAFSGRPGAPTAMPSASLSVWTSGNPTPATQDFLRAMSAVQVTP